MKLALKDRVVTGYGHGLVIGLNGDVFVLVDYDDGRDGWVHANDLTLETTVCPWGLRGSVDCAEYGAANCDGARCGVPADQLSTGGGKRR